MRNVDELLFRADDEYFGIAPFEKQLVRRNDNNITTFTVVGKTDMAQCTQFLRSHSLKVLSYPLFFFFLSQYRIHSLQSKEDHLCAATPRLQFQHDQSFTIPCTCKNNKHTEDVTKRSMNPFTSYSEL
jgi:hypothetical protein